MQEQKKEKGRREREGKAEGEEKREGRRKGEARWAGQAGAGPHGALSLQESKGYDFESETDTESIAKLVKYMYDNRDSDDISFTTLVERVIQQLVTRAAGGDGGHTPRQPHKK